MPSPRDRARRAVYQALRGAIAPAPRVRVSEWAGEHRWVAGEASSRPGRWNNELTPYLAEVMDSLSFSDPSREVVFKKSAQIGASEVGLNWLGSIIHRTPMPVLVALPKHASMSEFAEDKLEKMISATAEVNRRVFARKSRSRKASSTRVKRFRGGSIRLVNASSSADMQSKSVRALICEEVTEYPADVQGLGDPVSALRQRTEGYSRERKIYFVSTPGIKGGCRISALYAESDQAKFYVPCPHCGDFQQLLWKNMKWQRERAPFGAYFVCASNGCIIEPADKRPMVALGVWIRCFDGGEENPAPPEHFDAAELPRWRSRRDDYRARGFWIWRAYSPFSGWDDIVREYFDSKGDPQGEKQFTLKVLGLEYEEKHDVPAHQVLHQRREEWPAGRVPPWCLYLTGAVDVQGNRLEWAVYGWDRHDAPTLIDRGVILGDTGGNEPWDVLTKVVARSWPDSWGRAVTPEAWGIDAGFETHRVYRFVRPYAEQQRPAIMALDGRAGWGLLPIGAFVVKDINFDGRKIGAVKLWPVGTWDIKSAVARALRLTEQGPDGAGAWPKGAGRFPTSADIGFFEQLTAEACVEKTIGRGGRVRREWIRLPNRPNEQLDILVYAKALAKHTTAGFTAAMWDNLTAKRQGPAAEIQPDMALLWSPPLAAEIAADTVAPPPPPPRPPAPPGRYALPPPRALPPARPLGGPRAYR